MEKRSFIKQYAKITITSLVVFFGIWQPVFGQSEGAKKLFAEIRQHLNAPVNEIEIYSLADCTGPEGTYKSEVKGDGFNLFFSQVFSYRDESLELHISGDEGTDASGKPLDNFMIFYGRMHDYVRIALQPEYLIRRVDSVITNDDGSTVLGKTHSDYKVEYVTNDQNVPINFTFYLDKAQSITTWFDEWMFSDQGIKVPKTVRIVDGEKVFTFSYTDISIKEIRKG